MRVLCFSLMICLLPMPALGQGGAVCLFADVAGTNCPIDDTSPGILRIYVVHQFAPGVTAVEFWAPKPMCMVGATWLSDEAVFPVTIGDSQTDVAIGYGGCLSSPVHVLTMNYMASGTSSADCAYPVLPNPRSGGLNTVDCNSSLIEAAGGTSYINSTLPCECEPLPVPEDPVLAVTPQSLSFAPQVNQRTLTISNVGTGVLTWSVTDDQNWMSVSPSGGVDGGSVVVTVDRTGLEPGDYNGSVTVTSNGGDVVVPVAMTAAPVLSISTPLLNFGASTTQLSFAISNTGVGTLNWEVTDDAAWISIDPPVIGAGNATIVVRVDRSGLPPDEYAGLVTVTSNGGNAIVLVIMSVSEQVAARKTTWGKIKALYR